MYILYNYGGIPLDMMVAHKRAWPGHEPHMLLIAIQEMSTCTHVLYIRGFWLYPL